MKTRRNAAWALALAMLLLALAATPAGAVPRLGLELNRDLAPTSTPLTHGDERALYRVVVKNTASTTPSVGDTLTCANSLAQWFGVPSEADFTYRWLRNGAEIPGESAKTYVTTGADEGQGIQCQVTGTNPTGTNPLLQKRVAIGSAVSTSGSNVLTAVATAEGTGTLVAGSPSVSGVTVIGRPFLVGQTISATGIAPGTTIAAVGPGTLTLSQSATASGTPTLSAGAQPFAVGQEVKAETINITPALPPDTTITAVNGQTLTLSNPATLSSSAVNVYGTVPGSAVSTTASTISLPPTVLSPQPAPAAPGPVVVGISESRPLITNLKGSGLIFNGEARFCRAPTNWNISTLGDLTAASNVVSNLTAVAGSGNLKKESPQVTGVIAAGAPFAVGQTISGTGIPAGTTIAAIGPGTLELSAPATATSNSAVALSVGSQPFAVGQTLTGFGIPAGTTITAVGAHSLTLSANATATATGVVISTPGTWTYQWLRNGGAVIPGATSLEYVPVEAEDEAASLECEVFGKSGSGIPPGGGVTPSVSSPQYWVVSTRVFGAYVFSGTTVNTGSAPAVSFSNQLEGEVKVEAELPGGAETYAVIVVGDGWSCAKLPPSGAQHASATCTRKDSLAPAASYPPIELLERPGHDAPDLLLTKVGVSGGGAPDPATAEDTIGPLLPANPFGFKAFKTEVLDPLGADFHQAGGHPFSAGASLVFNEHVPTVEDQTGGTGLRVATGSVREIRTEAPPGFVGNPQAAPSTCQSMAAVTANPSTCPASSVVGSVSLELNEATYPNLPVFAMKHEYGTPAQFAFAVEGVHLGYSLTPQLRPGDGYAVTLVTSPVPKNPELFAATAKLCGFGAEVGARGINNAELEVKKCLKPGEPGAFSQPFLTLPTRCGDAASTTTRILADSWEEAGNYAEAQFTAPALTGCYALEFEPTLKARPTTNAADSPTGLEVDLEIPQNEDPEGTATAQLNKTVVTLPEGLVINPSGANGLDACSPAQIKLGTNDPIACPNASKVGSVQVTTPILDHPLPGALYVATPHDNPFNSLLALYLVVDDPQTGILIKLPGHVVPDPSTGQLITTFDQNPQAPVEDVVLKIRGGASAPLRTPTTCAKYTTTSSLTPWSAPDSGPPATPKDSWSINRGPGGGACASAPPNAPVFEAGTASPIAAAYSPFVVKLRREDGSQEFSSVTVTPPPGLVGKLAGIPYCPDSALAAAAAKTGREEEAVPSCPAASQVGTVVAGAGAGPAPYYAQGKAYLTGPYKGAPLSLAIITPAVAGPFDLGTVVVRTALQVNPETAQITAVSDPLPSILQGIPLDIRSVAISMDRPSFTLNPTSCDPMAVAGQLTSTLGQSAALTNRFQLGECGRLGFKPNLGLRLKGAIKRSGHPALTATLTYPKGPYANVASASVALPHSEFLDQAHIRTICTRVQFAANQCPAGAIYGHARAITPLLDAPLEGPVYLRSSSNPLPDLVADLNGQIHVVLDGRVDSVHGGIRTTFAAVPDAPVSKFVLEMQGGKKGLLINSRNICKSVNKATAKFNAQNGKAYDSSPVLRAQCPKKRADKGHQRRG